jgi:hypothetical protein
LLHTRYLLLLLLLLLLERWLRFET